MLELLLNAEVWAPSPLGRCALLVGGGKILWLGHRIPRLPPELQVREHDLGGARLVPGLVDGHVHVTGGGGEAGYGSRVPVLPVSRFTRGGVTTVIGVLGTDDTVRTTGELVAAVRGLEEDGISAWCHTGGYHLPPTTLTGSVRSDIVHIDRILGVGELAISDHRSSQPTLDELLRLASDAHVAGLMSGKAGILHLHLGDGERGLELVRQALDGSELPPRVFQPTHVNRRRALFDEALELAGRGVTIDVTAFPVAEGEDAWSAEDAVDRYLDSGLPTGRLTVSSDGGGCLPTFDEEGRVARYDIGDPGVLARCLIELLHRGRSLEEALPPFTTNPARLLRLPGKGVVAIGADADLLVLGQDHRITDVMARGRWHLVDGAIQTLGRFEFEPGSGP